MDGGVMFPAKPDRFDPEIPPPGFEKKLISFWRDRPKIVPRLQLVHTNAASVESNIEKAYNWANQPGSGHTIPHCQIDRNGRGAMLLPSDRKGIANYKAAGFSLGFETADRGYLTDPYPTGSEFTAPQADSVAVCLAYYAWGYGIPLFYPDEWDGTGSACHTEPFGYPLWTNSNGKTCPGDRKKWQVREQVLPRARQILAAWTAPPPPPPLPPLEDDMAVVVAKLTTNGSFWYSDRPGMGRIWVTGADFAANVAALGMVDAKTGRRVDLWANVNAISEADLDRLLGPRVDG